MANPKPGFWHKVVDTAMELVGRLLYRGPR